MNYERLQQQSKQSRPLVSTNPTFLRKEDGFIETTFLQPNISSSSKRFFQAMMIFVHNIKYHGESSYDQISVQHF